VELSATAAATTSALYILFKRLIDQSMETAPRLLQAKST
jgi:hypothetical protein